MTVTFRHTDWLFGGSMTSELEPGVLDESAFDVFTTGQCHSFALALGQELDRELVVLATEDDCAWHVAVVYGDDGYVDARGLFAWGDDEKYTERARCRPVAEELLEILADAMERVTEAYEGEDSEAITYELQVEDARPFARAAIHEYDL